ncbi:hypothetical protein HJG60_008679 [Phyllostomus discolor]|uniref:Uncharacterized protein n=1 Tax=Phyllostomus discolor TaxID=89673 RepID=A0A833YXE3_9CHIR|nr:hypothetical protein HJG60_008679 [Phyllostomus discolor]
MSPPRKGTGRRVRAFLKKVDWVAVAGVDDGRSPGRAGVHRGGMPSEEGPQPAAAGKVPRASACGWVVRWRTLLAGLPNICLGPAVLTPALLTANCHRSVFCFSATDCHSLSRGRGAGQQPHWTGLDLSHCSRGLCWPPARAQRAV